MLSFPEGINSMLLYCTHCFGTFNFIFGGQSVLVHKELSPSFDDCVVLHYVGSIPIP